VGLKRDINKCTNKEGKHLAKEPMAQKTVSRIPEVSTGAHYYLTAQLTTYGYIVMILPNEVNETSSLLV